MQKAMQSGEGKCRGKPLYDQEMPNACVLASCRMVIRELTGVEKDEEALMNAWTERGYSINSAGSDPSKIGAFLASQGVPGAWLRIPEGEDTKSKQQWAIDYIFTEYRPPFLVGVKNGGFSAGHCIIVDGCSPEDPPKKVKIRDPAWVVPAGCREIPIKEFNDRFDPRAGVWILRGRL